MFWSKSRVYGFFAIGDTDPPTNVIDYIDVNLTTGNATDRGDLTAARYASAGVSGYVYGFIGGGTNRTSSLNVIDYIDVNLTTGNATDRGDLTVARMGAGGVSGSVYGFFGGGVGSSVSNVIDYIDVNLTTGNATDRGDLTAAKPYWAGV